MSQKIVGLTDEEVKKSYMLHGSNSLKKEKRKGFLRKFFENLSDPIIRILIIALSVQIVFSFGNCNYLEIFGIIAAIMLSTLVSTLSEHKSELAFEKLEEDSLNTDVSVLRNESIIKIKLSELVVGDIVYLSVGEKIPADGKIIFGKVSVDQSALNGESTECLKFPSDDNSFDLSSKSKAFRGSLIVEGSCIMKVERIGESTYYGMVARDVQTETRKSPLKIRLEKLASQISKIGYCISALVGVTYLFNSIFIDNNFDKALILAFVSDFNNLFPVLLRTLTLMITVIVVAAPEGLPMMITVVLSSNMKRMINDNVLVRKMTGIETAGSMNILFTDKTGTITVGEPKCDKIITVSGCYSSIKTLRKEEKNYEYLAISAKCNTDVQKNGNELIGGNATDRAIFEFFDESELRSPKILEKISFSSERKFSSVRLENGMLLIKGAPEIILSKTQYAFSENGDIIPFEGSKIMKQYYEATKKGQRVLAVAATDEKCDSALIFVAIIVMKDKVRKGVSDAVKDVQRAGIQIVMITGDGIETASAIAEECGIYKPSLGHMAISADKLQKMSDDEVKKIIQNLRVISRALPQDKTRLVRLSQDLDLVVGMTGDGINDAPSLKLSDVGFAMGSGTDIAKSASDVVILDNSFTSIAKTVLYGRNIFKSIRKFITFQLTMNLCACGVSFLGQFIGIDTPITIIQMLWVNIIMDTLGGLAFAGESAEKYYMSEKPKKREEQILNKDMISQIIVTGCYTLLVCLLFLTSPVIKSFYGGNHPTLKFYTAFYALFIFSGIFNCFVARCERLWFLSNIAKNKLFVPIMLLVAVIQCLMIYFGGSVFRCTPLEFGELSFAILLASTVIPFELIRRFIYKLK